MHFMRIKKLFNAFKRAIFSLPQLQDIGRPSHLALHLKILTPNQMLQRLPIALEQVKVYNTYQNLVMKSVK